MNPKILCSIAALMLSWCAVHAEQPLVKPSNAHLRWHQDEQIMFVHFDPAAWQGREYDNRSTPLSRINPTQLETDQWCRVAKSWGAKAIIFVAKHVGGFCWWQTDTTPYSIKNTPYKEGRGDVLMEISQSCQKYGLDLGVYVYSGDESWGATIGSGGKTTDPAQQETYNKIYRQQLTEVLTRYGKITELWFDGGCVIPVDDILSAYASDAVVFQGTPPHQLIRWVGSEDGYCFYPNHYVHQGIWNPVEADVPMLKNGGHKWFWAPNTEHLLMTTPQFIDRYYHSVGRGAVLLLNSSPDTTGLIPAAHAARYAEFGQELQRRFAHPLAKTDRRYLLFDEPTRINHVILQEDLRNGQAVHRYRIEGLFGRQWSAISNGLTIGQKRIDRFDPVEVSGVRVVFEDTTATVAFKNLEVLYIDPTNDPTPTPQPAPKTVLSWHPDTYTGQWKEVSIDLTPFVTEIGTYELRFVDADPPKSIEIKDETLSMYGQQMPRLIQRMADGNVFVVTRSQQTLDDFPTTLTLKIRQRDGSSSGVLTIAKQHYW